MEPGRTVRVCVDQDHSSQRRTVMKKVSVFAVALVAIAVIVVPALAAHYAVKVTDKEGVGRYLTDTEGKALYWFKKDSPGKSACAGPCLEKWPVYYRETVAATGKLKAEDFGTITREDGNKQTTFRGYPLYYFFKDTKAGETNGQGVNHVWFVIDPDKFQK
jgi:predicted lipoprotein with Yx(FWY)xxD motif